MEKCCRAGQVTWCMSMAFWITKVTNTDSEYIIFIFFNCNNGCTNTPQSYVYTYTACHLLHETIYFQPHCTHRSHYLVKNEDTQARGSTSSCFDNSRMYCIHMHWWATCSIRLCFCEPRAQHDFSNTQNKLYRQETKFLSLIFNKIQIPCWQS